MTYVLSSNFVVVMIITGDRSWYRLQVDHLLFIFLSARLLPKLFFLGMHGLPRKRLSLFQTIKM